MLNNERLLRIVAGLVLYVGAQSVLLFSDNNYSLSYIDIK